jgi:hypothetical protein
LIKKKRKMICRALYNWQITAPSGSVTNRLLEMYLDCMENGG